MQIQHDGVITLHPSWQQMARAYVHLAHTVWKKTILTLLTLQASVNLVRAGIFLLVEYPELETQLERHEIDRETLQDVSLEAVFILMETFVQVVLAIQLVKKKETLAETINVIFGTCLILFSKNIKTYVTSLELFARLFN